MNIKELKSTLRLTWNLSRNDFKTRYAGSYFGIFWAFVNPIVTIVLYWFVFSVGLKAGNNGLRYPFVLWMMSGLIPWFFFQESLTNATNALIEYSYLVKKVVFKIEVLPIIKIISAGFIHVFFLFVLMAAFLGMGYYPTKYTIQVVYYDICLILFVVALSYATSAMVVFFRDLMQIINIFMQVFMWMTPIMWNEDILTPTLRKIFHLNPVYYIIRGYRDSLLDGRWFYQNWEITIYFWVVLVVLFFLGRTIFKRLKPHFADVL